MKCSDAILSLLLLAIMVTSSMTDIHAGLVKNKPLLILAVIGVLIHFISQADLHSWSVCCLLMTIMACFLYGCHIVAAGDSKLLIALACCFPSWFSYSLWFPTIAIPFLAFVFGSCFILGKAIRTIIQKHAWQTVRFPKSFFLQILATFAFSTTLSLVLSLVPIPHGFGMDIMVFLFSCIAIRWQHRLSPKIIASSGIASGIVDILLYLRFPALFSLKKTLAVLAVPFTYEAIHQLTGPFCYEVVPIRDLQPGMILSLESVLRFQDIAQIAEKTSEDVRCRLSTEDIFLIQKKKNQSGRPCTIVKKEPFAISISLGTLFTGIYLFLGVPQ